MANNTAQFLYQLFLEPKSQDEDKRTQEFIVTILVAGSVFLSLVATVIVVIGYYTEPPNLQGSSPFSMIIALAFFLILYGLARSRFFRLSSILLVAFYFLVGTYTLTAWGIQVAEGWLIYALVIIMAGILLNTRIAFGVSILVSIAMGTIGQLERSGILFPDRYWIKGPAISEILEAVVTFLIITIVSWLANREIHSSLRRARHSEKLLIKERDSLEERVEERTRELRQAQYDEVSSLYRFAQFGRLATGMLHDLLDPLTVVSLNLEELNRKADSVPLKEAIENTKRMEDFIEATRMEIQDHKQFTFFSVTKEIKQVMKVLKYRAARLGVQILLESHEDTQLYNSPIKFHQLISNLLSNAVDSYRGATKDIHTERNVMISCIHRKRYLEIVVTDQGSGIAAENLGKIFEPLFTTKSIEDGTGLGLSICKEVVEQDFSGSIFVESTPGKGSTFRAHLPLQ